MHRSWYIILPILGAVALTIPRFLGSYLVVLLYECVFLTYSSRCPWSIGINYFSAPLLVFDRAPVGLLKRRNFSTRSFLPSRRYLVFVDSIACYFSYRVKLLSWLISTYAVWNSQQSGAQLRLHWLRLAYRSAWKRTVQTIWCYAFPIFIRR